MHQCGVGRQAREHLTGLGGFKKFRALVQHVAVDGVAQVSGDPLAQPADHVEAPCGQHAQRRGQQKKIHKMAPYRSRLSPAASRRNTAVDQAAQCQREGQRGGRCGQQKEQRHADAHAVRLQKRQQTAQRGGWRSGAGGGERWGHKGSVARVSQRG